MTELTITAKEVLQELIGNLNNSIEEAEVRRKSASAKNENYKLEYSEGEKHAYEDAAKQLTKALDKV
jgi:hypothetical protein|tara:strand:- start:136 stop:336 length:201 start_codon:yes stop_codon:yes gene_type:complete